VVLAEEPALADLPVVVRMRLDPRLSLDDHGLAREPGPASPQHPDQHQQEGPVEQQAPDLAGEALLRGDRRRGRVRPRRDAEQAPSQHAAGPGDHPVGRVGDPALGEVAHRIELAGRLRSRTQVADRGACPRDKARDQRDEQQDVDQREPPAAEHVEQPDAIVDLRAERVVAERLRDAGVGRADLRHERARDRRDREHQQQDQRRPHRAEAPPDECQRLPERDARGGGSRGRHAIGAFRVDAESYPRRRRRPDDRRSCARWPARSS
jgi:hypothetical protein